MKKYILAICSLLAFVACNSFDELNDVGDVTNAGEKIVVSANIKGAGNTRVAMTPGTDSNGNPIIKTNWKESGESFVVWSPSDNSVNDTKIFTQISGNKFEGECPPAAAYYLAYYNCTTALHRGIEYCETFTNSLSQQDGTLNENYVVMTGRSQNTTSDNITFDFEHLNFILKPTFKLNGVDIDASIDQIKVENVTKLDTNCPDSHSNKEPQTLTVTPLSLDDIYIFLYGKDGVYTKGHTFNFTVTTTTGLKHVGSLTLPIDLVAGKFYTATINLRETLSYLPNGSTFRNHLKKFLTGSPRSVDFVANSNVIGSDDSKLPETGGCPVYFKVNDAGNSVEIHTIAEKFIFNEDCSNMFYVSNDQTADPRKISWIDFKNCDTSRATKMKYMFCNGTRISSFYGLTNFDTSNVTDMRYMFMNCGTDAECNGVYDIDLSSFNTEKVTNMSKMFSSFKIYYSDTSPEPEFKKTLNVSNFNTSNVTDMFEMFWCFNGRSLNVSNFDMSKVTDIKNMFCGASYLQELKLGDFNVPNETPLTDIFFHTGMAYYKSSGSHPQTEIKVSSETVKTRLEDTRTTNGLEIADTPRYAKIVVAQ